MLRIFLLSLISSVLLGCVYDVENTTETYIGGEIINPVLDYIVLLQKGKVIDTIALDSRNRFSYKFKTDTLGLFTFRHREGQLIHLEEGDSVLMRVNTIEFDESLSFSGKGAERSNFLANMYLHWEKENEGFTQNYQKNPADFEQLLDSLQNIRNRHLTRFLSKYEVSQEFQEIASAAVHLDNHQRKESYPFSHYGKDKLSFINKLPEDFYSFRESIDRNNSDLFDLYAYQRYLNAFIDNQAFMIYGDKESYNTMSYAHTYHEIEVINKYIKDAEIKDTQLQRTARIYLANSNDKKGVEQIFALLDKNISSPKVRARVESLYLAHKKMEAGNKIPDLLLIEPSPERKVTLSSRLNRPTVIYFWSYNNQMHMENTHKKIEELSSKYPEFNFLGINLDIENEMWQRHLKKHPHNVKNEYRFDNTRTARKKLVIDDISKTIVVDKYGIILNSHSNLHRATFENELLAYLNQ